MVDPGFASLKGVERDLLSRPEGCRDRHYVITDAIKEMEWWAAFHPEGTRLKPLPKLKAPIAPPKPTSYLSPRPPVREAKIGRNDPCPRGSGKKYKKCCGKN